MTEKEFEKMEQAQIEYSKREKLKYIASHMAIEASSMEEKKRAFLLEWYSRFMRSLSSCSNVKKHPSFADYVSMILYQHTTQENSLVSNLYDAKIIDSLIKEFGTLKGIPYGSYFPANKNEFDSICRCVHSVCALNEKERPRHGIRHQHKEASIKLWAEVLGCFYEMPPEYHEEES